MILDSTKKLLEEYQRWQSLSQVKKEGSMIHVDEVASKVASFYEKTREVIDWREEHLLRKTAIERMLKRRFFMKRNENIAEPLICELIRGGHFPNDSILEEKIKDVQIIIDKYASIIDNAPEQPGKEKMKIRLNDWLLSIAACEIEDIIVPYIRENALMEFMLEQMKERIKIRTDGKNNITESDKNTQIYIAIQKTLFKLDPPLISYNLFKKWYPNWNNLPQEKIIEISKNIYEIWNKIEKSFNFPLAEKFYKICERKDTPYLILGDIIGENPREAEGVLENPVVLESRIRSAYNRRLDKVKATIKRAAFYSTLSILLTKMILALAIEVPFEKYVTGEFGYFNIGLNVTIPPLLMFLLILSIKTPSKRNEDLVVMEVIGLINRKEGSTVEMRLDRKYGTIFNFIFGLLYFLSFIATFGFIFWVLNQLNFSIISIIIFVMFISLISFAGTRIRGRAKELVVEKENEKFLTTLFDLFSLPVIQLGKWLSNQWSKHNALAVLLNSLLDMPFQIFVEFLEQWRSFMKEKKEKIH